MKRYPARVLTPLGVLAGFILACSHGSGGAQSQNAPSPTPPDSAQARAPDSSGQQTSGRYTTEVGARRSATSLNEMLAGRISGVTVSKAPNGGISVLIRGSASFYSSVEPLYVVDGVPVTPDRGGTLSWIRPEDVESIAVLKDADAAIYGVRGANGVILIKTKGTH